MWRVQLLNDQSVHPCAYMILNSSYPNILGFKVLPNAVSKPLRVHTCKSANAYYQDCYDLYMLGKCISV